MGRGEPDSRKREKQTHSFLRPGSAGAAASGDKRPSKAIEHHG